MSFFHRILHLQVLMRPTDKVVKFEDGPHTSNRVPVILSYPGHRERCSPPKALKSSAPTPDFGAPSKNSPPGVRVKKTTLRIAADRESCCAALPLSPFRFPGLASYESPAIKIRRAPENTKKIPCKWFKALRGKCRYGDECH